VVIISLPPSRSSIFPYTTLFRSLDGVADMLIVLDKQNSNRHPFHSAKKITKRITQQSVYSLKSFRIFMFGFLPLARGYFRDFWIRPYTAKSYHTEILLSLEKN